MDLPKKITEREEKIKKEKRKEVDDKNKRLDGGSSP